MAGERRAPGVYVSVYGSGIPEVSEVSPAQYFGVGLYEWGAVNTPTYVAGLDDFRLQFGDNVSYSAAPEHYEAAYNESRDTLSGWIVRVFETAPGEDGKVAGKLSENSVVLNADAKVSVGSQIVIQNGTPNPYDGRITAVKGATITVSEPLGDISAGADWYTVAKTLDDYKARCPVKNEAGVEQFVVMATDPGSKGNTFRIEIAPYGLNPKSDRKVRIRGRYRNYDFEWKGVGTPPTEVAPIGPNSTPEEISLRLAYETELRTQQLSAQSAIDHNREIYQEILKLAEERQIDFTMIISDPDDDAFFSGNLAITQKQIMNIRIDPEALEFYGGMNGESIDNAPVNASKDVIRGLTNYKVLIGDFDANAQYTGLQALNDEFYGTGAVCIPGYDIPEVWEALMEHAETYNRLAVANMPRGISPQNAAIKKAEFGGSKNLALYYGYNKANDIWIPTTALAMGVGSRETSRVDKDGGIKASWTGRVSVQAVEQFYGRDAVDDSAAELFSRADVGLNYVRMVTGIGYRLDSQRLSLPQGAISRVYHTVVNNVIVYSIKPAVMFLRDRTIDREGTLIDEFINTMDSFFSDYGPGKAAPRGNTLWNPAVIFDASTINDLRNHTLRIHIRYSQSPKAERILIGIEQQPVVMADASGIY